MQDQSILEREHLWLGHDPIGVKNVRISCNAPGFVFGGPLTVLANGTARNSTARLERIDIFHFSPPENVPVTNGSTEFDGGASAENTLCRTIPGHLLRKIKGLR